LFEVQSKAKAKLGLILGTKPYQKLCETKKVEKIMTDYAGLSARIDALCAGETDEVALMATLACEVHQSDERFHWTGFYRVVEKDVLKIGPYQGGHGCLVIPFSRGVCGACARTREVQLVPDVEAFSGHIACASSTRSELVLPVQNAEGELLGVFDIDSDFPNAFTQEDAEHLGAMLDRIFANVCRT
jgi:GAF domain-containing protein